jgi:hypothetical protein
VRTARDTHLPFLRAIVQADNQAARLGLASGSMCAFLNAQGLSYEIIVAAERDDASRDIVSELARKWPSLRLTSADGRHVKGKGQVFGLAWRWRTAERSLVFSTPTIRLRSTN